MKYVKIRPRHLQDDVFDFVLVSSLLTLNIFHTLSCLYCWIWTGKYLLQTCVIAHSMYTGPERHHCPTVVIVNFEHITLCSSVSTVVFGHAFIFWVWSFYMSIVFRLRWIKGSFIYRKDFHKVKYLYEVEYSPPRLVFRNLFEISKLEWVKSFFY